MATFSFPSLPKMSGSKGVVKPCICGCNQPTKSTWYPGHDGRATGWATRIEKGIITIDDVPENERNGARVRLLQWQQARKATKVG